MFLSQIKSFKHTEFWRYLVGSGVVFGFSIIGQFVMLFAWIIALGGYEAFENYPQSKTMQIFDKNTTLFFILLSFAFALLGLVIAVKKINRQKFLKVITSRNRLDWKRILFSFGLFAVIIIVTTVIDYYSRPEDFVWNFKLIPFLGLAIIGTALIPIQTSVEEFVFRGYLMQGFAALSKSRIFALVLTSLIFGLLHIANPEIEKIGYIALVFYIGTGIFLGTITLMDEGTELALGFHAANNLITALLVTSDWTALQTNSILKDFADPEVGLQILAPVFIMYPILIFIYARKYQWSNWKQKLFGKI